jgi:hypothetical protein
MVAKLIESLPKRRQFHLYFDNLFVCWRLSQYFKIRDIALTDICRKEVCDYFPKLLILKSILTSLSWDALQEIIMKEVFV